MDEAKYIKLFGMEKSKAPVFDVKLGDIIKDDWSGADFIIANSTCFSEGLMESMAKAAMKCKKGSWFVTLTKRLPTADDKLLTKSGDRRDWDCVLTKAMKMSWGIATIHVHKKIKDAAV